MNIFYTENRWVLGDIKMFLSSFFISWKCAGKGRRLQGYISKTRFSANSLNGRKSAVRACFWKQEFSVSQQFFASVNLVVCWLCLFRRETSHLKQLLKCFVQSRKEREQDVMLTSSFNSLLNSTVSLLRKRRNQLKPCLWNATKWWEVGSVFVNLIARSPV